MFALAVSIFLSFPAQAEIQAQIDIQAPLESTWTYAQDDRHAADWSIFFSSIEMAPVEEYPQNQELTPSDLGFIRRCYRNEDKAGLRWDEENIRIDRTPNRITKEIRSFNFVGYGSWYQDLSFRVIQEYTRTSETSTRLKFSSEPYSLEELRKRGVTINALMYHLLIFLHDWTSGARTLEIFKKNLENIKYGIEHSQQTGELKRWPYDFEKFCDPESDFWCSGFLVDF